MNQVSSHLIIESIEIARHTFAGETDRTHHPMEVKMASPRTVICFAFVFLIAHPCTSNCYAGSDFFGKIEDKILIRESWKDVRISLVRLPTKTVHEVDAKKAVFEVRTERRPIKIPVVAFIAPEAEKSWIGPEQTNYIETDEGIIGIHMLSSDIVWETGLLSGKQQAAEKPHSMSQLLDAFDEGVTGSELLHAAIHIDPVKRKARRTSLKPAIKNPWMFTNGKGSSQLGRPKVLDVDAGGKDTVIIELTDQTEEFHAKIWMNVKTRRVTKVEEGPWDRRPKQFVPPKR